MTRLQDTSLAAYRAMLPHLQRDLAEVVSYLLDHPDGCTADEYKRAHSLRSPNQSAPRFTHLKDLGVIEDSGLRRLTELGHSAIVWRLVGAPPVVRWEGCPNTISGWHTPIPANTPSGHTCARCGATE